MEFAALAGLVALGTAVSQLAAPNKKGPAPAAPISNRREGFHNLGVGILPQTMPPSDPAMPVPSEYYTVGLQKFLTQAEAANIKDLNDNSIFLLRRDLPAVSRLSNLRFRQLYKTEQRGVRLLLAQSHRKPLRIRQWLELSLI